MYQNHFANQTKAEKMEVVEILQNCATAPKQISDVGVGAAGRHVGARAELKYMSEAQTEASGSQFVTVEQ